MANKVFFIDIDGVVADCTHRLHYQEEKDYDGFYSADEMLKDSVLEVGKDFIQATDYHEADFIYVTGRPERTRIVTEAWGSMNYSLPRKDKLLMRKDGDYRDSGIVKTELIKEYIIDDYYTRNYRERRPKKIKESRFALIAEDFFAHYYNGVFMIDDDPKNIMAVTAAFPRVTGITFGVSRMPVVQLDNK